MANLINKTISQTNKQLFIVDLSSPDETMEIQFVPQELRMSGTTNHARMDVVGRNNPLYQYINGEDSIFLELDFYADDENKEDVVERVRWLQSLRYNDGFDRRKKNVLLVWGDLFSNSNLVWIVTLVNVEYSGFHSEFNYRPVFAKVFVTLVLDPSTNIRVSDIRQ